MGGRLVLFTGLEHSDSEGRDGADLVEFSAILGDHDTQRNPIMDCCAALIPPTSVLSPILVEQVRKAVHFSSSSKDYSVHLSWKIASAKRVTPHIH